MSKTLIVSDKTYELLKYMAHKREMKNVEEFLEGFLKGLTEQAAVEETTEWEKELEGRHEQVERIKAFQKQMAEKYNVMPDSVDLIREDRNR